MADLGRVPRRLRRVLPMRPSGSTMVPSAPRSANAPSVPRPPTSRRKAPGQASTCAGCCNAARPGQRFPEGLPPRLLGLNPLPAAAGSASPPPSEGGCAARPPYRSGLKHLGAPSGPTRQQPEPMGPTTGPMGPTTGPIGPSTGPPGPAKNKRPLKYHQPRTPRWNQQWTRRIPAWSRTPQTPQASQPQHR